MTLQHQARMLLSSVASHGLMGNAEAVMEMLRKLIDEADRLQAERDERELALATVPGYTSPAVFRQEFARVLSDLLEAEGQRDALGEVAFEAYRATGADADGAQDWRALFLPMDRHSWTRFVVREIEDIVEQRIHAEEELDAINEITMQRYEG